MGFSCWAEIIKKIKTTSIYICGRVIHYDTWNISAVLIHSQKHVRKNVYVKIKKICASSGSYLQISAFSAAGFFAHQSFFISTFQRRAQNVFFFENIFCRNSTLFMMWYTVKFRWRLSRYYRDGL